MAVEQARFIDNHRNIPILQVPLDAASLPGIQGQTLKELLHANSLIQRVAYDQSQCRYHVSTSSTHYKTVYDWIDRLLKDHQFPFSPQLRPLRFGNSPSYGDIFKDAVSVATGTFSNSPATVSTGNAWRNRPPLAISYVHTDAAFPPLPMKKTTPTTASTTSETFEDDTIQSAISAAIKKLEDQHKSELLLQALTGVDSPLATKADNEQVRSDINIMKTQLATILALFQSKQGDVPSQRVSFPSDPLSPPRISPATVPRTPPALLTTQPKRSKVNTTPVKMQSFADKSIHEQPETSATSTPDAGMEGCDD